MPASKVKNIVIFILIVANLLLLGLVIPQARERSRQRQAVETRLESLFHQAGIRLETGALPDTRLLYTVEFTPANADTGMETLLGTPLTVTQDAAQYSQTYQGPGGICQTSRSGLFSARLSGQDARDDLRAAAVQLLEQMGLSVASAGTPVAADDGHQRVTVWQQLLEMPVFSAAVTVSFLDGVPVAMAGTAYCDTSGLVRIDDSTCCSAVDALAAFLASRNTLGWVGSTVTAITQGYRKVETASATVVRLAPGWQIETDTGTIWINGISRTAEAVTGQSEGTG